jgi:hypothetical protein
MHIFFFASWKHLRRNAEAKMGSPIDNTMDSLLPPDTGGKANYRD